MATELTVKNILPDIPITLSMVVGDIVIRFGGLERVLATAMARVKNTDKRGDQKHFRKLLGEYKQIGPLGRLISKARIEFKGRKFEWIDFDSLEKLRDKRNAIHDALVDEFDGTLTWQASGKRRHRPIDHAQLLALRECVERTIMQINEGSLQYKKSKATK